MARPTSAHRRLHTDLCPPRLHLRRRQHRCADGRVTAYTWDFGRRDRGGDHEGRRSHLRHCEHVSRPPDRDRQRRRVQRHSQSVLVHASANVPPTATFTSSCAGLACSFTGLGSDGDGTVVRLQVGLW